MPFCPKCQNEFQDWVVNCPDYGITLVAELPTQLQKPFTTKKSNDPPVYITTAPNEPVAKMWEGILNDEGIHCVLNTGNSGAASASQIFMVPVTIHVLDRDVKRAKKLLNPYIENKLCYRCEG